MADTKATQKKLFQELKGRIQEDDSSVPTPHGPFEYQTKYKKGGEYPLYVRKQKNKKETILLDTPKEAKSHKYFDVGIVSHSPDHTKLAWSVDTNGSEYYELRLRDLETNTDKKQKIKDVGDFAWTKNGFVFVRVDKNHRPSKVFCVENNKKPKLIYEEKDPRFFVGVSRSLDDKTIKITSSVNDQDETMIITTDNPLKKPTKICRRKQGHEYSVQVAGNKIYILTNSNNATNYRLVTASTSKPAQKNWREIIPHRKDVMIEQFVVYKNYLVRVEKQNALQKIIVRNLKTKKEFNIKFGEEAYAVRLYKGLEFDTDVIRFSYSSPVTPTQVWDYNLKTKKRKLRKEQKIPSGHNKKNYVVKRLHATARDKQKIPLTLIYKKGTKLNGTAPCMLYGYGSYGMGMTAGFAANRLSLVDRGFVYVTAHIRGGDEKGREWYEQTKKEGKTKTFHDFIDAAKFLVGKKITKEKRIVAMGGSAGGLLMGAVVNMNPELFAGVIAQVPFVDVLNTMLDDTLPLTPGEWSQWGNPIKSKKEYRIIEAYSPYDNVIEQEYPPIFALAGITDPRVQYWEPAKWVAKLREKNQSSNPIMLKTNMGTGHFGKTGRFAPLEEVALVYTFALKAVGKK